MEHIIVEIIKYTMIFLIAIYSYYSFAAYRAKQEKREYRLYSKMTSNILMIHFLGHLALYVQVKNNKIVYLYIIELLFFLVTIKLYQHFYPRLSRILLRNMILMMAIGFVAQLRLSEDKVERQIMFAILGTALCLIVPKIIETAPWLGDYGWVYGIASIVILIVVLFFGITEYGATNWFEIKGHVFQPFEFVKIIYIFCIAAMFSKEIDLFKIVTVSVMAAAHVLILVFQRELGGALIFYITYIVMLYVASGKALFALAGLFAGGFASTIAYKLFNHVRVRVMVWKDPLERINSEGFQVSQSLFAIGTGGWLGMGINKGLPTSIPVVESDFIFSAISEEFGGFFALCIILVYINTFLMMILIAFKQKDKFYRLLSLGFATMFSFQVFLSIGGGIKLIPSTGVTLPLISYGGSSILATIAVFMIIQGIYIRDIESSKR